MFFWDTVYNDLPVRIKFKLDEVLWKIQKNNSAIQLSWLVRNGKHIDGHGLVDGDALWDADYQLVILATTYKWRLNSGRHRMLYSCAHMAAVGVKD